MRMRQKGRKVKGHPINKQKQIYIETRWHGNNKADKKRGGQEEEGEEEEDEEEEGEMRKNEKKTTGELRFFSFSFFF